MGDYFARAYEFSVAVAANWLWWVSAVPFVLDQLLSRNFWSKATIKRLSRRWPEGNRHKVFKWLAVAGFVISCFMAFDHVNSELKNERAQVSSIRSDLKTTCADYSRTGRS
jgi:hypothetical protein